MAFTSQERAAPLEPLEVRLDLKDHCIEHELFEWLDTRSLSKGSPPLIKLGEIGAVHPLLVDQLREARVRLPNGAKKADEDLVPHEFGPPRRAVEPCR